MKTFIAQCGFALLFLVLIFQSSAFSQSNDIKSKAQDYVRAKELEISNKPDKAKFWDLMNLAPAALEAGDLDKAERFVVDLQASAGKHDKTWESNRVNDAIHLSNTILGLIAIEKGNTGDAKKFLLASSKVTGGGIVKSFGPNMLLARKLIEKNERETVIQFLDNCSAFWELDRGRLAKWKTVINDGGMPDFGGQLSVQLGNWKHDS